MPGSRCGSSCELGNGSSGTRSGSSIEKAIENSIKGTQTVARSGGMQRQYGISRVLGIYKS
jgi:hypothetical protein